MAGAARARAACELTSPCRTLHLPTAMQFDPAPPDVIRSVRHRWLFEHWNRLRGPDQLPASRRLVADDLTRMVDVLMFCDVVQNGSEPRLLIRFRGQRILETYGECDGKFLDETLPDVSREATLAAYAQAIGERTPVYTVAQTFDPAGKPVDFERLLLPFSRDGGGVDRVLTALEWVSIEGAFERDELLRRQPAPRYSVRARIAV